MTRQEEFERDYQYLTQQDSMASDKDIAENVCFALINELGLERVAKITDCAEGKFHAAFLAGELVVTVAPPDYNIARSVIRMFMEDEDFAELYWRGERMGITLHTRRQGGEARRPWRGRGERKPVGDGFGKQKYRVNAEKKSLELSFGYKPEAEVRARLKAEHFRWSPTAGAWYIPLDKVPGVAENAKEGNPITLLNITFTKA